MRKIRKKASDLSEGAIVERAKSLATNWMWAVLMQHDRITKPRPQDKPFNPFRLPVAIESFDIDIIIEADFHFLVIALRRLRTVATTLEHVPQVWDSVLSAIRSFDDSLPWLKKFRDVFEHLEDYAVDSNLRRSGTSRRELQVWSFHENGLHWLGYDIDWEEALAAAKNLYDAVKAAHDLLATQRRQANNDEAQNPVGG